MATSDELASLLRELIALAKSSQHDMAFIGAALSGALPPPPGYNPAQIASFNSPVAARGMVHGASAPTGPAPMRRPLPPIPRPMPLGSPPGPLSASPGAFPTGPTSSPIGSTPGPLPTFPDASAPGPSPTAPPRPPPGQGGFAATTDYGGDAGAEYDGALPSADPGGYPAIDASQLGYPESAYPPPAYYSYPADYDGYGYAYDPYAPLDTGNYGYASQDPYAALAAYGF